MTKIPRGVYGPNGDDHRRHLGPTTGVEGVHRGRARRDDSRPRNDRPDVADAPSQQQRLAC